MLRKRNIMFTTPWLSSNTSTYSNMLWYSSCLVLCSSSSSSSSSSTCLLSSIRNPSPLTRATAHLTCYPRPAHSCSHPHIAPSLSLTSKRTPSRLPHPLRQISELFSGICPEHSISKTNTSQAASTILTINLQTVSTFEALETKEGTHSLLWSATAGGGDMEYIRTQ